MQLPLQVLPESRLGNTAGKMRTAASTNASSIGGDGSSLLRLLAAA